MAVLKDKAGISSSNLSSIPQDWSAEWFRRFATNFLQNADTRNAVAGPGIVISGDITQPGTISTDNSVQSLFHQPYLLASAPVGTFIDSYRLFAVQTGVLAAADGGATHAFTLSVVNNGIGATQLRQSSGTSVMGNPIAGNANVSDIVAAADDRIFQRTGGILTFGQIKLADTANLGPTLTVTGLTAGQVLRASAAATAAFATLAIGDLGTIAANTFVGNNTGAPTVPTALTQAQATALLNQFTTTLQGVVPASGGGTSNFLRADGTWTVPSGTTIGANPTASIGLTVVNGVATTFMRSDGAPPLDVTISPTWTGQHTFNRSSGTPITIGAPAAGNAALMGDGTVSAFMNFASAALQIGCSSAHALTLDTNNIIRFTVLTNGGVTVALPSSGTVTLQINGGTSSKITFDGSTVTSNYTTAHTLDDTGYHVRTNSASRNISLGTNSLDRITASGAGQVQLFEPNFGLAALANACTNALGTFTATLTGCTTSPTGTVSYARAGNLVTLTLPAITATSNATTCTITGLPVAIQPATLDQIVALSGFEDNTVIGQLSGNYEAQITHASGTITFSKNGSTTGFTNVGTKGTQVSTFSYSLQ